MTLQPGTKAPDFTLTTAGANGPEKVTLSEVLKGNHAVLLFFPMAFTGGCTQEFCDVSQGLGDYEGLGAKVLGISGDNPFAQAEWASKEGITTTLLSDYEHEVTKAYGVAYETFLPEKNLDMGGVSKRSAFVVSKSGEIVYSEAHDDPHNMPDFDKIKEALSSL